MKHQFTREEIQGLLDTADLALNIFRGALDDSHDDSYSAAEELLALTAQHALDQFDRAVSRSG